MTVAVTVARALDGCALPVRRSTGCPGRPRDSTDPPSRRALWTAAATPFSIDTGDTLHAVYAVQCGCGSAEGIQVPLDPRRCQRDGTGPLASGQNEAPRKRHSRGRSRRTWPFPLSVTRLRIKSITAGMRRAMRTARPSMLRPRSGRTSGLLRVPLTDSPSRRIGMSVFVGPLGCGTTLAAAALDGPCRP